MEKSTRENSTIPTDFNGQPIQEGAYLDSFGRVVQVGRREDEKLGYRDDSETSYTTLGEYASILLWRIKSPREASNFLEQVASEQSQPSRTEEVYNALGVPITGPKSEKLRRIEEQVKRDQRDRPTTS